MQAVLGSWFNSHLGERQRIGEGLMDKDQDMELVTDAPDSGRQADGPPLASDDRVMAILEHWRSAWTDLSRTEAVIAQGPSFVLWYSDKNGTASPGGFVPADALNQLIPPEEVREAVRKQLSEMDHARQMTIVLLFRNELGVQPAIAAIPKTAECKPQAWFEMTKIRKTSVAQKIWIPLRAASVICREGEYGYEGFLEEYLGVSSVMFELADLEQIRRLSWNDIGTNHFAGGFETEHVWPKSMHSADVDSSNDLAHKSQSAEAEHGKILASVRVPFTNLNVSLSVRPIKSDLATPALSEIEPDLDNPGEPERIRTYHRAGDWASNYGGAVGTGLVIEQSFDGEAPNEWHLSGPELG